jgi:hypothetical protein
MAVLVAKTPQKRYQILGGTGLSEADVKQADRLDSHLEAHIRDLVDRLKERGLMPSEKGKGSLLAYWELGRALVEVVQSKDFPNIAELPLLWRNAKLYVPDVLLYEDRGPYREHLWYCYRLGGYPKAVIKKMRWGEWVTLFDSNGINQEARFDIWFKEKLSALPSTLDREWIRMFAPCVNKMLGNIDTHDLSDVELFNCFEAAWQVTAAWRAKKAEVPGFKAGRKEIQKAIDDNLALLDQVMEGMLTPGAFAEVILAQAHE